MKHLYAISPLLLAVALASAPASAADPEAAQWTGVFTGRHVNGAPVYRLPSVTVVAARKALASEAPVYRLPPITVVAERETPAARKEGRRPEGERQARSKPARPPA
jgi:hypothetical protein